MTDKSRKSQEREVDIIEREIAAQRADLDQTLDLLEAKLQPRAILESIGPKWFRSSRKRSRGPKSRGPEPKAGGLRARAKKGLAAVRNKAARLKDRAGDLARGLLPASKREMKALPKPKGRAFH